VLTLGVLGMALLAGACAPTTSTPSTSGGEAATTVPSTTVSPTTAVSGPPPTVAPSTTTTTYMQLVCSVPGAPAIPAFDIRLPFASSAPTAVDPGAAFDISVSPAPIAVPVTVAGQTLSGISHLRLRVPVPQGTRLLDRSVGGGDLPAVVSDDGNSVYASVAGPITAGSDLRLPTLTLRTTTDGSVSTVVTRLGPPAVTFIASTALGNLQETCVPSATPALTRTTVTTGAPPTTTPPTTTPPTTTPPTTTPPTTTPPTTAPPTTAPPTTAPPTTAPPATRPDSLMPGQWLTQDLVAPNGIILRLQPDGNLVVIAPGNRPIWCSDTYWSGSRAIMQTDGNFVIIAPDGKPVWSTNTFGHHGSELIVQADGNLVVVAPGTGPIWASGSHL
jgi:hypothetical protein